MTWRAISINKEIYNKPVDAPEEIRQMGAVKINLFLPPTDIPKFVRAEQGNNSFVIKFVYSLPEKGKFLFSNDQANFLVGEESGKPLAIEIKNVRENKIDKIELTHFIRNDLDNFISSKLPALQQLRQRANVERAQEFLRSQTSDLVSTTA